MRRSPLNKSKPKPKPTKTTWGGARPGAGRKPGSTQVANANQRARLAELCRLHTEKDLRYLRKLAYSSKTPRKYRIQILFGILDRGYGRPPQAIDLGFTYDSSPIGALRQDQIDRLTPKEQAQLETFLCILAGEHRGTPSKEDTKRVGEERAARALGYSS